MKFLDLQYTYLIEAEARIQHAEDFVFWRGSEGANHAIQALRSLSADNHKQATLKWDGSPAVIFGRDDTGNFVFTDKGGFNKSGGAGRVTNPADLKNDLLNRSGGKFRDDPDRIAFAVRMAGAFEEFKHMVPETYRGFFKGDMLYFDTPKIENGNYVFKPQLVTYEVDADSELGKKIGNSTAGIVIHREVDAQGNETALKNPDVFNDSNVLVFPPVTVQKPAKMKSGVLDKLEAVVNKNSAGIDELLNPTTLKAKQMTDLPQIFYTYINSKVDTGLDNLGKDFLDWLSTSRVSPRKQERIAEYIQEHQKAYGVMWQTVAAIMKVKDYIIAQFDKHDAEVKQSIAGTPGGEGYVLVHPEGDVKLVPREFFSRANRAQER